MKTRVEIKRKIQLDKTALSVNEIPKHNNAFEIQDFAAINLSQKTPKEMLKQFLLESVEDEPYVITISGNEEDGASYLHRMRVELSRFRTKIVERGGVPKKFKILCSSIVTKKDSTCEITIVRSLKAEQAPDKDLNDLLGVLSINEE